MSHDELMRALIAERYTNTWWKTAKAETSEDTEQMQAQRRRLMEADYAHADRAAKGAA